MGVSHRGGRRRPAVALGRILQMLVEEGGGHGLEAFVLPLALGGKAVAGALDDFEGGRAAGLPDGFREQFALVQRDGIVLVPMGDEERGSVFGDIGDGIGLGDERVLLLDYAADEPNQPRVGSKEADGGLAVVDSCRGNTSAN